MSKKLFFLLLLFPQLLVAQINDQVDLVNNSETLAKRGIDTLWDHSMEESDLIMKVKIERRLAWTGHASYAFTVLEVVKGEYPDDYGFLEFGADDFWNYERRIRPMDNEIVYLGFDNYDKRFDDFELVDKAGTKWEFFISALSLSFKKD